MGGGAVGSGAGYRVEPIVRFLILVQRQPTKPCIRPSNVGELVPGLSVKDEAVTCSSLAYTSSSAAL